MIPTLRFGMRIGMKKFIIRVTCVLLAAAVLLQVVQLWYRKNIGDMKRFSNVPDNIMVANVGSSHGECDFLYDDLKNQGITCFNFGIQAQTIEYDEKILNNFIDKMAENSYIIVPVSYMTFMLSDDTLSEEDFELKNNRYYSFMKYQNMIGVTFPEYFKTKYLAYFYTDMRVQLSDYFENLFTGKKSESEERATTTMSDMDSATIENNAKSAYERHVLNFKEKDGYAFRDDLIEKVYAIIEKCREHNITPILITTPYSKAYNDCVEPEFLEQFNSVVDRIVKDSGVQYYDYARDDRFYDDYSLFLDTDHLNNKGALKFTDIVYDECILKKLNNINVGK